MTRKDRNAARDQDCTLRIHGPANCSSNDTVVLAHAPCRDSGTGFKSPDRWAAFACFNCHDILDTRLSPRDQGWIHDAEKPQHWLRGIYETQKILGVFDD